jgi:hypothetical protein
VHHLPQWIQTVCYVLAAFLLLPAQAAAVASISGAQGFVVTVDPTGTYDIQLQNPAWTFGGSLGTPLSNLTVATGADSAGSYGEISFDFRTDAPRHAAIRAYQNHQAVLFTLGTPNGGPNSVVFPNLSRYPTGLNHIAFAGTFANYTFTSLPPESPWMFFDSAANAFIVSAASHFMVSQTSSGPHGELMAGVAPSIASLPPGFSNQVLLVADSGINRTFESWGQTLTGIQGKTRPANDADVSLNRLNYWTDNGASYYYHSEAGSTAPMFGPINPFTAANPYEQTLWGVKSSLDSLGIGIGALQLDSWFYPKGANLDWTDSADGIYEYQAAPTLFTSGLTAFQKTIGLPLITHARWIDASSPYRQKYQISGNVATDPAYWYDTAAYLKSAGVSIYEQDWLGAQAQTAFNLTDADAFLDNMAVAMNQQGINMQYCMATPRHFLQASKYGNLTTIRVSGDRFEPTKWSAFLYTSRLAGAVGAWPFTDVFMSGETGNLILASLSAGPVGIGDRIGSINKSNLLHAVRLDGVIVKPDVPITPLDNSYLNDAQGPGSPMIASTYTDFGDLRTYYLFAYPQGTSTNAQFSMANVGAKGPVYLYDYIADSGAIVRPSDPVSLTIANGFSYMIAAPVGPSGMALLGDIAQYVTMGKKRVSAVTDNGMLQFTVTFAKGETSRIIQGYSPDPPHVHAQHGVASFASYDYATQRFHVVLSPGADGTATVELRRGARAAHGR